MQEQEGNTKSTQKERTLTNELRSYLNQYLGDDCAELEPNCEITVALCGVGAYNMTLFPDVEFSEFDFKDGILYEVPKYIKKKLRKALEAAKQRVEEKDGDHIGDEENLREQRDALLLRTDQDKENLREQRDALLLRTEQDANQIRDEEAAKKHKSGKKETVNDLISRPIPNLTRYQLLTRTDLKRLKLKRKLEDDLKRIKLSRKVNNEPLTRTGLKRLKLKLKLEDDLKKIEPAWLSRR